MNTAAPFPIDPELTAIAIAYRNPDQAMIADEVLPRTAPVGTKAFTYNVHRFGDNFTIPDTRVGRKGRPNTADFGADEVHAAALDYGLDGEVPQDDINQAKASGGVYNPVNTTVEGVTGLINLDREVRVARLVHNVNTYPANNRVSLTGADKFSDPNGDPVAVINEMLMKTLVFRPNIAVFSEESWGKTRANPNLVKAVNGTSGDKGLVTREQFKALFELQDVLVGSGVYNTTRPGQSVSLQGAWGNGLALLYRNRAATSKEGITFGMSVPYGTKIAGQWPDKDIGLRGGVRVRSGDTVAEIITAADTGAYIDGVV